MKSLKKVLRPYIRSIELGDNDSSFPEEKLKSKLQKLNKSKDFGFFICSGMVVFAFLVSICLVVLLFKEPDQIVILFSGTGLTTAGLISVMRGIWKEKIAIELTIALLESMEAKEFQSILQIILKKF